MNISHIEHIAIAVTSLDEAVPLYEKLLGVSCYAMEEVADQKVRTAFFRIGQTKIELLEGTAPDSPVSKFILRRGEGIHHVAFKVADVDDGLKEMESRGFRLIDTTSRRGAEGLDIGFLHPSSTHGVLIELCGVKDIT